MVRFTLRQLEYADAVAHHGGIAQAARSLNVSQPSVAQGLDKLEAVTSLVLFERHHARGVTLTAQGRLFLERARDLVHHAAQVKRDADALAAYEAGEIRLGCFATIAAFYLPGLMRSFDADYPGIQVRAREANLDQLSTDVGEGSLDVCLTYDIGDTLSGFHVTRLAVVTPTVMLSSDHPKAGNPSISLAELDGEPYVMYDAPGSREYFTALLDDVGLSPPIAYASETLEGVRSAVGAGFGFSISALSPSHDITYEGREIVAKSISDEIEGLAIVTASRHDRGNDRMLVQFIDHASRYFDEVNWQQM